MTIKCSIEMSIEMSAGNPILGAYKENKGKYQKMFKNSKLYLKADFKIRYYPKK